MYKRQTFDGARELDLAPGAQAGDVLTLRGLGVTHLRGTGRGDLIVHTDVMTPTKLTEAQQDLLRQLAALRGEERPVGRVMSADKGGFMGKLRDAFKGA